MPGRRLILRRSKENVFLLPSYLALFSSSLESIEKDFFPSENSSFGVEICVVRIVSRTKGYALESMLRISDLLAIANLSSVGKDEVLFQVRFESCHPSGSETRRIVECIQRQGSILTELGISFRDETATKVVLIASTKNGCAWDTRRSLLPTPSNSTRTCFDIREVRFLVNSSKHAHFSLLRFDPSG